LYADRLASIVHDEYYDLSTPNNNTLYRWIEKEYGTAQVAKLSSLPSPENDETETHQLQARLFTPCCRFCSSLCLFTFSLAYCNSLLSSVFLQELQHFLDWFRSRFPYYYDRCDVCGASERDKLNANTDNSDAQSSNHTCNSSNETSALQEEATQEEESDKGSFLGYVYPNEEELEGKASRTELYLCKECNSLTRFPRYNSASWIIQHGRGRCGEYSMLLYRMLRTMGYEARWVVDWSDHVFCEVRLRGNSDNKWVHLDPCEAAVNKPLLYQEWGKEQTYIIAFHAPPIPTLVGGKMHMGQLHSQSLIEDVTKMYTSDSQETILKRRDEPVTHIESSLVEIQDSLLKKLSSIFMSYEQGENKR
jgi:hypothetical protein